MTSKQELIEQRDAIQTRIDILNGTPEDIFNLGTVAIFASGPQGITKWYYVKVEEETWRKLAGAGLNSLSMWILQARESQIGYFEVYILTPGPDPIYTAPAP